MSYNTFMFGIDIALEEIAYSVVLPAEYENQNVYNIETGEIKSVNKILKRKEIGEYTYKAYDQEGYPKLFRGKTPEMAMANLAEEHDLYIECLGSYYKGLIVICYNLDDNLEFRKLSEYNLKLIDIFGLPGKIIIR